jgi:hypothetical protein
VGRIFVARRANPWVGRGPGGSGGTGFFAYLSLAQGIYYVASALWALLGVGTFQKVTGPKTDVWLVKTVGVLVAAIGGALGLAGFRRRETLEIGLLGAGSASGLAGIDTYYVARGRISPVYGLDAVAEIVFLCGWIYVLVHRRGVKRRWKR